MNFKEQAFVNVSPMRVKKSHSKLKKRTFYGLLIGGALTVFVNYFKTEMYFHYSPTEFNKKVIHECRELRKGIYKPTWFLPTAFMQAVYGAKIDPVPYVPFERERVPLKDGGALYIGKSKIS